MKSQMMLFVVVMLAVVTTGAMALPVADAVLHLDAGTLGLADGAAVSSWGLAAQATADNQPTFIASSAEFNGNAVVRFDGTDDWMALSPSPINVGSVTMFAVGKFSNPSGGEQYLLAGQDGGGNDRIRFAVDGGGYEYRIGSSGWRAINTGAGTADGDVHVFAITSAAEGFLDGVSVGTSGNSSTETPVALNIGSYNVGQKAFFSGDIAELIMYNRVLTAQEITDVSNYLAVKHIPEPATLALLGLGSLCVARRRRSA